MWFVKTETNKGIKHIQWLLNHVDNINDGGCGISALAMYRWLKKNKELAGDESFTFYYRGENDPFYIMNNNVLKKDKMDGRLNSAAHVMLFHNGRDIDSMGECPPMNYDIRHEKITEDLLLEAINYGDWNSDFNRKRSVNQIEIALKIDLSDVSIRW